MANADDKLYRSADGHAWVGECWAGKFPENATHVADPPAADDPRWTPGAPPFPDVEFVTLSPFSPSGRLGVCVEKQSSKPLSRYPNHPVFDGCRAWMPVSAIGWTPIPRPERTRYVVMDEHTLGYLIPETPSFMGVLAGSVLKGGHDWKNGPVLIVAGVTRLRQATLADFDDYRVLPPRCFADDSEPQNVV